VDKFCPSPLTLIVTFVTLSHYHAWIDPLSHADAEFEDISYYFLMEILCQYVARFFILPSPFILRSNVTVHKNLNEVFITFSHIAVEYCAEITMASTLHRGTHNPQEICTND